MVSKTLIALAGSSVILATAAPAGADTFTLLIYETDRQLELRQDEGPAGKSYWSEFADFSMALQKAGVIRGGAPLSLPAEAVNLTADGRRIGLTSTDGAFLSGYFQIEVATLAEAEKFAALVPSVKHGGRVEIRASYPSPAMPLVH